MAEVSENIRVTGIFGRFSRLGKSVGVICVLMFLFCGFRSIRAESLHEGEIISGAAETKRVRLAPESALLTSADSAAMQEIRARMDEIRKRRPTVALVLSGGGAKGAAHIGVIRYLETVGIPVDMIIGTSMGGLVGGLYALGYNVGELDSLVRNMDWSYALSDRVPREYISYSETKYREKYLLSIPFYYRNNDENDVAKRHGEFKIGADSDKSASELIKNNFLGSLPSGYIFGQNVSNIFSSLSVGYQDSLCFNDLPIPFACVATDLVSGTAKIWHNGKINTALRSTMSIPGVFAPVKIDGMVLVDGGMRDNYPTGLARDMGADIVIGVDLSGGNKKYEEINNLGDIITSGIDMLGRSMYEKNVLQADISIRPELKEYNMMSFDKKSISIIIQRGYEAAYKKEAALMNLKSRLGPDTLSLHASKAIDINADSVKVRSIDIQGVNGREKAILMKKIDIMPGDKVCRRDIENIVADIFGTQAYDYVSYEMRGRESPFDLVIICRPGPVHQFGFGVRLDTEEIVSVLLNVGFNAHRLHGSRFDFTGKISANPYFRIHYSYDAPKSPTLNAAASVKWTDMDFLNMNSGRFNMSYLNASQEFYLSNLKWSLFDIRAGIRNEYFNVRSLLSSEPIAGDYDLRLLGNDYMSLFLEARADTFDDGYFPKKGFTAGVEYAWAFAGFPENINNFHAVSADAKFVVPGGDVFAFIPSFSARFLFGQDIPVPYMNLIGGSMSGRYMDQQMAFIGLNNVSAMRNILTVFRTDFRFNVARNHYLSGIVNYARDCDSFGTYAVGLGSFGAGVEYSYDSIFGPMTASLHWSSLTRKVGFYIGLGYNF